MPSFSLTTDLQFVKGIGPKIAESLKAKGILTIEDLLHRLPFRYEDRLHPVLFSELRAGEMASVIGEVRGSVLLQTAKMPIFELTVGQNLKTLKCMWFRGTWLKDKFQPGQLVVAYGKVEASRSGVGFKMIQPQVEVLPEKADADLVEVGRITPVYESLGGQRLGTKWLRRVLYGVLSELGERVPETLPAGMLGRLGLPGRGRALQEVHFPPAGTPMQLLTEARTPAQKRLIFEELFYLELGLELKRRKQREQAGIAFATDDRVRTALRNLLPFRPTAAQKKALAEIAGDMRKPTPMRRLLQGDVGSGKTIVAVQAMLIAIENGYQAALMAPTEILATQHYLSARKLLERAAEASARGGETVRSYRTVLLTGSLDPAQKRWNRQRIMNGDADLVIGTHALIEDKVEFAKLGLVVVDEQHRFGVLQRFRLMRKPGAAEPDLLAMTATPIPRTLALTLYGDLEVSVLDELPPGRTPVVTRQVTDERAEEVWGFVRKEVARGRQAYIVYPVIEGPKTDQPELEFPAEEAPPPKPAKRAAKGAKIPLFAGLAEPPAPAPESKSSLKSATEMYEELRHGPLHGLRLGLLHGRLPSDEKDIMMRRFTRGEIDVLVSTTVIEVGVDVPNATIMVIEHAERFGLSQMHQLRGRVGRGSAKSYCILMTGGRIAEAAQERLAAMVRTQDGFELAELDLQLRGPGEFFGTRQSGLPDFRVASLIRDRSFLEQAKAEAQRFVAEPDAEATPEEKAAVWAALRETWQRRYGLVNAG